jgi:PST family polysaccharide transporter
LKNRLKNYLKKDLVKVVGFTAIANFLKIFINLISTKIVAVFIGPQGVALVGQFLNLFNIGSIFSSGGISNGVIKYISEYKEDNNQFKDYLGTALSITLFFSLFTSLILGLFSNYFCIKIFGSISYISILYVTAFTISLFAINSLLLSVINGLKLFQKFILINIISSLCSFIFTITLVYFYKVYGALLALATYQSVVVLITILIIKKNNLFNFRDIKIKFDISKGKQLLSYSMVAFVALLWPLINIIIRTQIINSMSAYQAGVWEGMTKISTLIVAVIGTSISTYYLPRLSEITSEQTLRNEIYSGLKLFLSVTLLLVILLYVFRDFVISILYTKDFSSMSGLFMFQLLGDFFWVAKMTLSVNMLARAMIKEYIVVEVIFAIIYLFCSLYLIHTGLGIVGVSISHMIYNLLYFITMIFVFRRLLFSSIQKSPKGI